MMVSALASRPPTAHIRRRNNRRWWLCANCEEKLGELIGGRLLVLTKHGKMALTVVNAQEGVCARCLAANVITPEDVG